MPAAGLGSRLTRRRQLYGLGVAAVGAPLLTLVLLPGRDSLGLDTVLLLFILVSVAASAVGGVLPALAASLISFGLANFFFTPPYGSLLVENNNELIDLVIFFAVAVGVGVVTEIGARGRCALGAEPARGRVAGRTRHPGARPGFGGDRPRRRPRHLRHARRGTLTEGDRVLASSGDARTRRHPARRLRPGRTCSSS